MPGLLWFSAQSRGKGRISLLPLPVGGAKSGYLFPPRSGKGGGGRSPANTASRSRAAARDGATPLRNAAVRLIREWPCRAVAPERLRKALAEKREDGQNTALHFRRAGCSAVLGSAWAAPLQAVQRGAPSAPPGRPACLSAVLGPRTHEPLGRPMRSKKNPRVGQGGSM